MAKLPAPMPIQPGTWRQPVHSRRLERYVYTEEELRRAINDVIRSPAASWQPDGSTVAVDVNGTADIIIAGTIELHDTIEIPYAAAGVRIRCTGAGSIMPATIPLFDSGGAPAIKITGSTSPVKIHALTVLDGLRIRPSYGPGPNQYYFSNSIVVEDIATALFVKDCYLYGGISASVINNCIFSDVIIGFGGITIGGSNNVFSSVITSSGNVTISSGQYNAFHGCNINNFTDTASSGSNIVGSSVIKGTISAHASSNVNQGTGNENNV